MAAAVLSCVGGAPVTKHRPQSSLLATADLCCGYTRSGVIPRYALDTDGALISTVVFYELI
jgi:hypothetical protein